MASLKTKNLLSLPTRSSDRLKTTPTVFVGLSGGVDSAVSAALFKERGYKVVGVFIKVWTPDFLPCTWREDRRDAMRVAAHLAIPFVTLDLEKEYKQEVVDYMIREYKAGKTPNPDVMCNKEIKFGAFYDYAMKHGADFVATGHYAQIKDGKLLESIDVAKEQSYFIWNIKKEQIPHILFPVGGMNKSEVRKYAEKCKLPNALKKDSQGLCFLGKVDMKDFLTHFITEKKGAVINTEGKKIGTHDGVMFLTIGQRHGFTITNSKTSSKPYYIVAKDSKRNIVTVSHTPQSEESAGKISCDLTDTNWIIEPVIGKSYSIRFRYHQVPILGTLEHTTEAKPRRASRGLASVKTKWSIKLEKQFAGISPGQSAVIYDENELIGGGIIE